MNDYAKQLQKAETTVTITPSPLIMEKVGDKFRGLYLGQQAFQKTNPKTGEITNHQVAHFFDGERVRFNMGAQLTRAISVLSVGVSVEIQLAELKPNDKGGKTKIYSITPLNIPLVDMAQMFGGVLQIAAPSEKDLILPPADKPADKPISAEQINADHEAVYGSR